MLFSKRLTFTPLLVAFLQTTIQSRNCSDLQAELFLVHSPLLKESYLVSFPPLTYMLKFSGFANLTSCLECLRQAQAEQSKAPQTAQPLAPKMLSKLAVAAEPCQSDASRAPRHILRHRQSQKLARKEPQQLEQQSIDTEAGMLSGISQKHNMRSSPCRFTEFCNSQCLSHFAAPFIVDRTETSIAESCKSQLARAR